MSSKSSKKLVNEVDLVVRESLAGYAAVNPGVRILKEYNVVVRADLEAYAASHKVAVVSGGGSGHEPLFLGYVGHGMCTGVVHGAMFASPGPTPILVAIRALAKNNPAGVLVLLNNYTGDRLTFGQAIEQARAEGLKIGVVINADDCAVIGRDKTAGRRGLCGLILLLKIAGALAEEGRPLEEVITLVKQAEEGLGSLGVCLSPCSLPGRGPLFSVGSDEMEIGLGLHGEAGVKTVKMMTAKCTVEAILQIMTAEENKARIVLSKGDHVAVMLNNLGSISETEMNIVSHEVISQLEHQGMLVDRAYVGRFATSQEMAGISITVLKLQESFTHCLDAPTSATGWRKPLLPEGSSCRFTPTPIDLDVTTGSNMGQTLMGTQTSEEISTFIYKSLVSICKTLISAEEELNTLDSGAGDGDCGSTLRAGAEAILSMLGSLSSPGLPVSHPYDLLLSLAKIAEKIMGGTSGGVYGLFLTAAAGAVMSQTNAQCWLQALQAGVEAVKRYGGAEPGDRTMLDPLEATAEVLQEQLLRGYLPEEALQAAAKAADESAKSTAKMTPRAGRASYVREQHLGQPDPGAVAVSYWMQAISNCWSSNIR